MHYIIGDFNKYDRWDREHSIQKFVINEQICAIKWVELDENGIPQLSQSIEEQYPESYYIYDKLEDAIEYVKTLKSLN